MALLDHLQTFTWVTWIHDRVYHTRGSDSTRHHNAGQGMCPGIMEPKGSCAPPWYKPSGKITPPTEVTKHDVVDGGGRSLCSPTN
jgi:hypothetical protein